jgi:peptidoglycan hydrolase-like protein with peptidoglycan-binding domain
MCGTRLTSGADETTAIIPAATRPVYDSLFRQPTSEAAAQQTQLLAPAPVDQQAAVSGPADGHLPHYVPQGGYQVQPGDGYPAQPSGPGAGGGWDDDGPEGPRKPVIYGTLTAVGIAAAIILSLLYFGNRNNTASATTSSTHSAVSIVASATIGQIVLPSGAAPSAAASPTASASPATNASPSPSAGGTNFPLSEGSTGRNVLWLQNRLHQLGYYQGPISGNFDQATAQAVLDFQSAAHVTGDPASVVGPSTLTALIAAGPTPDLRPGDRPGSGSGNDVRRLQEALNSAENAGLSVNGRYDPETVNAVMRYQSATGTAPTGQVDAATWAALQSGTLAG